MEQRTCNIIMCCKKNTEIDPGKNPPFMDRSTMYRNVAAYMSRECACAMDDYTEELMGSILKEALFDYLDTADRPGSDLRNLFNQYNFTEPTMSDRIINMFQLVRVKEEGKPVNGFTDTLLAESDRALAKRGDPVYRRRTGDTQ